MLITVTALSENISENPELEADFGLSIHIKINNKSILLDAGSTGKCFDNAKKLGIELSKLDAILLSHGHFDHMLAADALRKKYHIPVYVHEKEQHLLGDPKENLSGLWSKPYTMQADKTVKEGDVLHLADFEIHVLATPGHTAGGVCYYIPAAKTLFSGDTLFCESYGRYDFPTSSGRELTA